MPAPIAQIALSAPTARPTGLALSMRWERNSEMGPLGVTRPIAPAPSVNHIFPSGPATIENGWAPVARPVVYSWIFKLGEIVPIAGVLRSVNHIAPPGPASMSRG